jgi:hypothetical protein
MLFRRGQFTRPKVKDNAIRVHDKHCGCSHYTKIGQIDICGKQINDPPGQHARV